MIPKPGSVWEHLGCKHEFKGADVDPALGKCLIFMEADKWITLIPEERWELVVKRNLWKEVAIGTENGG
jgi:hypothetical protein